MNRVAIEHTASVLGLAELTQQEVIFVQSLLRGMPLLMAAQQSGVPETEMKAFYAQPHIAAVLAHMRESLMTANVEINRDMLNLMLLEAHAKSANATEEVKAIRELGLMNGLYAAAKVEHTHTTAPKTAEQLKKLSSKDLARIAGEDDIIDGEWEDISDG